MKVYGLRPCGAPALRFGALSRRFATLGSNRRVLIKASAHHKIRKGPIRGLS